MEEYFCKGVEKMSQISAWDRVTLARMPERPKALDYINNIFIQIK